MSDAEEDNVPHLLPHLPQAVQQTVASLMKPRPRAAFRLSCRDHRLVANAAVTSIHVKVGVANCATTLMSISSNPLVARFPHATSLHLTTSSQSASEILPDDDAAKLIQICSSCVRSCTHISYSRHTTNLPPSPPLLSSISTMLTHCPKLEHLKIELLTDDSSFIPRTNPFLSQTLHPTFHLPLKSLSLHLMVTSISDFDPISQLTSLTSLTVSKVPISMSNPDSVADLVAPLTRLVHLSLGILRRSDAGYISLDLQSISTLRSLQNLQLNGDGCFLTPATVSPLVSLPHLTHVHMQTWRIMTSDALDLLACCSSLHSLVFDLCLFEPGISISPLSALTQLTRFALDRPTLLANQYLDMSRLAVLLEIRDLSLDWSTSQLEDSLAVGLWVGLLPGLTRLQLAGFAGVDDVLSSSHAALLEFHYHGNEFLDVGVLMSLHPNLEALTVSKLRFGHSGTWQPQPLVRLHSLTCHRLGSGGEDIMWMVQYAPNLKTLIVCAGCNWDEFAMMQLLRSCHRLEHLELTYQSVVDVERLEVVAYSFPQVQHVAIQRE